LPAAASEYDERRVDEDMRDRLPRWYADRGYIDFQVTSDSLVPDSVRGKATLNCPAEVGYESAVDTTDHIALVLASSRIVYTHDGGSSWTEVNIGGAGQVAGWPGFNSTAGWASDTSIVYLANEDTTGGLKVARSNDGGAHWSDATGDLPRLPVNKLIVDPSDATGSTVFVANWIGVYRTSDGGAHWNALGTGLPLAMISDLYLAPNGSFLRISSYGRGVWQLGLN